MREWVLAGMAQSDYVHLTAPGYHMIGIGSGAEPQPAVKRRAKTAAPPA
jgi:hypothetical protein